MNPIKTFVALGSNLGNSRALILQAVDRLQTFSQKPLEKSSLWQTTPVDCPPDSPVFLNAVVGLVPFPEESPESLLEQLQQFERESGRQPKTILNEARPLDLDLITFGEERRISKTLVLPHPRAHERRFVLEPLSELAPDLVLPGQQCTVRQLLDSLSTNEVLQRVSSL